MTFFTASAASDVQRHAGVVPFAVARSALDHRIVLGHAGLLRGLRNVVDIGAERDHRLALAPGRHPRRRNAGDAALDPEAFFLEDAGEVLRRLEFLEPEFAEAEDAVHHHLRLFLHGVDLAVEIGLHGGFFLGLRKQTGGGQYENSKRAAHMWIIRGAGLLS